MTEWAEMELNNWKKVWKTPLGVFIAVVTIALAALTFSHLTWVESINDRRIAFCEAENVESRRARGLWTGVAARSSGRNATAIINGRRVPVVFPPPPQSEIDQFLDDLRAAYPIRDCSTVV